MATNEDSRRETEAEMKNIADVGQYVVIGDGSLQVLQSETTPGVPIAPHHFANALFVAPERDGSLGQTNDVINANEGKPEARRISGATGTNMASPVNFRFGGDSAAFYQQQLVQTQTMCMQQQASMTALTSTVQDLQKAIERRPVSSTAPSVADSGTNECVSSDEEGSHFQDDRSSEEDEPNDKKRKADDSETGNDRKLSKLKKLGSNFVKKAEYAPAVNEVIASTVNSGLEATIEHKTPVVLDLLKKYNRPENCEFLEVPKVNKALWTSKQTGQGLKDSDKLFQRAQLYLTKGMIPLVQIMNKTLTADTEESEELFDLALDSFNLLAYGHRDLSNQRRRMLLPAIPSKHKQLCQESAPISATHLFGNEADLEKRVKEIDDGRKLGNNIGNSPGGGKMRHTNHGPSTSRRGYEPKEGSNKGQKPYNRSSYPAKDHFLGKKAQSHHNHQQRKSNWKKGQQGQHQQQHK